MMENSNIKSHLSEISLMLYQTEEAQYSTQKQSADVTVDQVQVFTYYMCNTSYLQLKYPLMWRINC